MWEPSPSLVELMADKLFTFYEKISYITYRKNLNKFFRLLKQKPLEERDKIFFKNYKTKDCCTFFILENNLYFTICLYPGSINEQRLYGKTNFNFNT
jgi:hypothetical protein